MTRYVPDTQLSEIVRYLQENPLAEWGVGSFETIVLKSVTFDYLVDTINMRFLIDEDTDVQFTFPFEVYVFGRLAFIEWAENRNQRFKDSR